ncbi:efflux pump radE [Trichoderma asperellum]|uniref:Efflux pump radE n=1 Tax=Trichoderma asperellum TaxID=101201 RepID=A0A6V8R3R5_TRIAP|nr:efflux pump radE [Trichoderma asperellum]
MADVVSKDHVEITAAPNQLSMEIENAPSACFCGFTSALASQLEIGPLSTLYHQAPTAIAYQNSSANAGMVIGGIFFYVLSFIFGRPSVFFWSLLGLMGSDLWSSYMTEADQFNIFIVSRGFAGFFGTAVGVLGPRMLIDMFFLHQRGRAFTIFHFFFDFGTAAGPSLCSFVVQGAGNVQWAFWFIAIATGFAALLIFLFVEDTTWDRTPGAINNPLPEGFIANRIATFLPGTRIVPRKSVGELARIASVPFKIAATPVSLMLGIFTLFSFGFSVGMNSLTPVWLQKPVKAGGYGFTPIQNALSLAFVYGQALADRLPLWLAARFNNGTWKPEYRLHALWLPALYHASWGVLAFGSILVIYASMCITPITVNYLSECFTNNVEEAAIVLNTFRIAFGLSIAFYITPWVDAMGIGWTYGLMAFIMIFSWLFVLVLMWKGHQIRQIDPFGLISTEEGKHVLIDEESV